MPTTLARLVPMAVDDTASRQDISTFSILIKFEATEYSYSIPIRNFEDIQFDIRFQWNSRFVPPLLWYEHSNLEKCIWSSHTCKHISSVQTRLFCFYFSILMHSKYTSKSWSLLNMYFANSLLRRSISTTMSMSLKCTWNQIYTTHFIISGSSGCVV